MSLKDLSPEVYHGIGAASYGWQVGQSGGMLPKQRAEHTRRYPRCLAEVEQRGDDWAPRL
jgi:hypothetical protein